MSVEIEVTPVPHPACQIGVVFDIGHLPVAVYLGQNRRPVEMYFFVCLAGTPTHAIRVPSSIPPTVQNYVLKGSYCKTQKQANLPAKYTHCI